MWALALARHGEEHIAFAGTNVGVYRSSGSLQTLGRAWERLPNAPIGVISLAFSAEGGGAQSLLIGTQTGVFVSTDGGERWQASWLPRSSVSVTAMSLSPDFARDGIAFLATAEDGVFFSKDRGLTWAAWNFGLLDLAVYSLAVSPDFAHDETLFAGTTTGLFYSYNGGRAWRELRFPSDTGPVLCLGISPAFAADGTLFAGTESAGLFRSCDRGQTWERLSLPGLCVNALTLSPGFAQDRMVLAATEEGLFCSEDGGGQWRQLTPLADVLCLAGSRGLALAGTYGSGIFLSTDLSDWEPVPELAARSLTGLKISPAFARDGVMMAYGAGEGLWRSNDAGRTWRDLSEGLPGQGIAALEFSPAFATDRSLYAALPEGVAVSRAGGESWELLSSMPSSVLALSPSGGTLLVGTRDEGLYVCRQPRAAPAQFEPIAGPWDPAGSVQAIAAAGDDHFFVAVALPGSNTVEVWQGKKGHWQKEFEQPADGNPVTIWIPPTFAADGIWYAAIGSEVWRGDALRKRPATSRSLAGQGAEESEEVSRVVALTGARTPAGLVLLASTGRRLYRSADGKKWQKVHDFGRERAITLVPAPSYSQNRHVYALMAGGQVWRGCA